MNVQIRPATSADLDALISLERSIDSAPHWSEETYATMLHVEEDAPLQRCLLVAEDQGHTILGFAVGKLLHLTKEAELESVAVAPSARRRGIARQLCEEVTAWARNVGAETLTLEVRASNAGAIALYDSLEFMKIALRKLYYERPTEDAVLMSRPLR